MTIAAPVAFDSHKYGVSVGTSFVEVPRALGAPSGQSGMGVCIWARDKMSDKNIIAEIKSVFMEFLHKFWHFARQKSTPC
jgi:hypothetical protein